MNKINDLSMNIRESPLDVELYLERGIAFLDQHLCDEAISDFLIYESLGGNKPEMMLHMAKGMRVVNPSLALKYVKDYVSRFPDDLNGRVSYAEFLFENERYSESAEEFRVALNLGMDPSIISSKVQQLRVDGNFTAVGEFVNSQTAVSEKKKSFFRRN